MGNYNFKINGHEYSVAVNSISDGIARVNVNGTEYEVEVPAAQAPVQTVKPVQGPAQAAPTQSAAPASPAPASGRNISSPLPGVIVEVSVNAGQSVRRGQKIAVLEAMKMENEIQSPADGTVTEIKVHKGDSILEGALIAVIG